MQHGQLAHEDYYAGFFLASGSVLVSELFYQDICHHLGIIRFMIDGLFLHRVLAMTISELKSRHQKIACMFNMP